MSQTTVAPTPTAPAADMWMPEGRWQDALSFDEKRDLLRIKAWRAWLTLAVNWGTVAGAMALVAWAWPSWWLTPPAIVAALFVIGGRQLACAIIMHDASHGSVFADRRLNHFAGNWLAAYPTWQSIETYWPKHQRHHTKTYTAEDPDLGLVKPFPITPASLRRKVWRDLSGRTGWKFAKFLFMHDWRRGPFKGQPDTDATRGRRRGLVISNLVILGLCTLAGYPALYLLWVGAWFTTYTLLIRIRSIAEHAMSPDPTDPLQQTRTTLPRWWERPFVAPNYVNYHLEHHLMMKVPHYNLPRMHRLLRERGALDRALITDGYAAVLRRATSRPAPTPAAA